MHEREGGRKGIFRKIKHEIEGGRKGIFRKRKA
jgi:hypothetical protein